MLLIFAYAPLRRYASTLPYVVGEYDYTGQLIFIAFHAADICLPILHAIAQRNDALLLAVMPLPLRRRFTSLLLLIDTLFRYAATIFSRNER